MPPVYGTLWSDFVKFDIYDPWEPDVNAGLFEIELDADGI